MRPRPFVKEFLWLAPFTFLGLVALAPMRSPPDFPPPPQTRVVTDAEGVKVTIPIPFRAVVRYGGTSFLETTPRRRRSSRPAATPGIATNWPPES